MATLFDYTCVVTSFITSAFLLILFVLFLKPFLELLPALKKDVPIAIKIQAKTSFFMMLFMFTAALSALFSGITYYIAAVSEYDSALSVIPGKNYPKIMMEKIDSTQKILAKAENERVKKEQKKVTIPSDDDQKPIERTNELYKELIEIDNKWLRCSKMNHVQILTGQIDGLIFGTTLDVVFVQFIVEGCSRNFQNL